MIYKRTLHHTRTQTLHFTSTSKLTNRQTYHNDNGYEESQARSQNAGNTQPKLRVKKQQVNKCSH